jgi:hypothetical protein
VSSTRRSRTCEEGIRHVQQHRPAREHPTGRSSTYQLRDGSRRRPPSARRWACILLPGIFHGKRGVIFQFLRALSVRLVVDIRIKKVLAALERIPTIGEQP